METQQIIYLSKVLDLLRILQKEINNKDKTFLKQELINNILKDEKLLTVVLSDNDNNVISGNLYQIREHMQNEDILMTLVYHIKQCIDGILFTTSKNTILTQISMRNIDENEKLITTICKSDTKDKTMMITITTNFNK